jgi:very-short-patch-repair endonuclease
VSRRLALIATPREELQVAELAGSRHRVIEFSELVELGISASSISRWAARGRLVRKYRGVYIYGGGTPSREGEFLAAVLAIGEGAALAEFAAAALWDFWTGGVTPIDVIVARQIRSRRGICVHCVTDLPDSAVTVRFGIPVTTPERTILDLAVSMYSDRHFRRLVHEAEAQERTSPDRLRAEIARSPRHRGAARVFAEIADGAKPTRSGLEDDLVELLRRHRFPSFETNVHVPGTPSWVNVDVLFRAQKVVIEVDGERWHNTKFRREFDTDKRALVEAADHRVIVLVEEDVEPRAEASTSARIWNELEAT